MSTVEKKNANFVETSKQLDDAEREKQLAKIENDIRLTPFSDKRPFNREANLQEIRAIAQMDTFCMIELGKRLIFHKENLKHGEFVTDLEKSGIHKTTAWRYMNVAEKLAGLPSTAVAQLTMSKAQAFAEELDDEDIKRLSETGQIGKVRLDDVDRMTANELRRSLRRERDKRKKLQEEVEGLQEKKAEEEAKKPGAFKVTDLDKALIRYLQAAVNLKLVAEASEDEILTPVPGHKQGARKGDLIYIQLNQQMCAIGAALKPEFRGALDPSSVAEKRRA